MLEFYDSKGLCLASNKELETRVCHPQAVAEVLTMNLAALWERLCYHSWKGFFCGK